MPYEFVNTLNFFFYVYIESVYHDTLRYIMKKSPFLRQLPVHTVKFRLLRFKSEFYALFALNITYTSVLTIAKPIK